MITITKNAVKSFATISRNRNRASKWPCRSPFAVAGTLVKKTLPNPSVNVSSCFSMEFQRSRQKDNDDDGGDDPFLSGAAVG